MLEAACKHCPDIAATVALAQGFNNLVRHLGGVKLQAWINQAVDGPVPEIRSFANGLYKDFDAVKAGLTLSWSSGAAEGHVNRIKTLKRQTFGRAKLDLLRKRILLTP
jgi:transposase